jgi:hypothetical protein
MSSGVVIDDSWFLSSIEHRNTAHKDGSVPKPTRQRKNTVTSNLLKNALRCYTNVDCNDYLVNERPAGQNEAALGSQCQPCHWVERTSGDVSCPLAGLPAFGFGRGFVSLPIFCLTNRIDWIPDSGPPPRTKTRSREGIGKNEVCLHWLFSVWRSKRSMGRQNWSHPRSLLAVSNFMALVRPFRLGDYVGGVRRRPPWLRDGRIVFIFNLTFGTVYSWC